MLAGWSWASGFLLYQISINARKHYVLVDENVELVAGKDRQRWLDLQVSTDRLVPTRPKVSAKFRHAAAEKPYGQRRAFGHRRVDTSSDQRNAHSGAKRSQIVVVHFVLEATVALSIHTHHADDLQRRVVVEDDIGLDDEHAALAERHLAVVASEEFRAMQVQQAKSGRAVTAWTNLFDLPLVMPEENRYGRCRPNQSMRRSRFEASNHR